MTHATKHSQEKESTQHRGSTRETRRPVPITVDPVTLPKHFDDETATQRWLRFWDSAGIYRFNNGRDGNGRVFRIDTPPPTVSGSLHVGHVFSYTHTDIIARYRRMRGDAVFYPMGWDDNGLPTERRVQNYFSVSCDPDAPYQPDFSPEPAQSRAPVRSISRRNFIELCNRLTEIDEEAFKDLWRRVGLSVDWSLEYATISARPRRTAQLSFLDLYEKGHAYVRMAPVMWDVDFATAVAQAEVEDREVAGAYHEIRFALESGTGETFTVATTRPELLPACVGITAHPDDTRYSHLFGRRAVTPLYGVSVPIFPSIEANPEKGTGILMVCTFGDATDVEWWRERELPTRQVIDQNGRMVPIRFGTTGWESCCPEAADRRYATVVGKTTHTAGTLIVEQLRTDPQPFPAQVNVPPGPAITAEPVPTTRAVRFYEKGRRPLEYISSRQWFVRLMDKKDLLLRMGREIDWIPEHMGLRYADWTEGLKYDWCISRQRFFGVPFPIWYSLDDDGNPVYASPIPADPGRLPVDPLIDTPPGYTENQRGAPGGFTGERDVFDTWFTSSLSPQITLGWDGTGTPGGLPMDVRPQGHDIIRTWAFYTIVKAALHHGSIPWRSVLISGWILDPDRKKMSKSKGNVVTPVEYLQRYTPDGVRYWAAGASLGTDAVFDEKVLKTGRRLVTKLYNAAKFVLAIPCGPGRVTLPLDLDFLRVLGQTVRDASTALDRYDHSTALEAIEQFFWNGFTDSYIELVKDRARAGDDDGRDSAVRTLRAGLSVLLRLFAPYLPFITEEIWSWAFATESGCESIHRAPWPVTDTVADTADMVPDDTGRGTLDTCRAALSAVHGLKTREGRSPAAPLKLLEMRGSAEDLRAVRQAEGDLRHAAKASQLRWVTRDIGEKETVPRFEIVDAVFTEER